MKNQKVTMKQRQNKIQREHICVLLVTVLISRSVVLEVGKSRYINKAAMSNEMAAFTILNPIVDV